MQLARVLFFVGVAVSLTMSSVCHANTSLPPVLNSYPKCDYRVLQQAEATNRIVARDDDVEAARQTLRQNAIVKIRRQATAVGAEAVILTDVQGVISNSESVRTIRHAGSEVRYRVAAELITLCQEDQNLPTVYTPYNDAGIRQAQTRQPSVATTMQFAIAIPAKALSDGNVAPPLANTISLQQGFYGAKVGMTPGQVQALFGMPDAELTLKNDYTAWIYGKEHQVVFAGNTAVAFSQQNNILSAEIKKRMVENPRFQQLDWRLDNTFSRRASLAEIKAFYQDKLIPLDQNQFALHNKQSMLRLQFASYLDVKSNSNQLQLVNVSLSSPQFTASQLQLKLPEPDSLLLLKQQLTTLGTTSEAGPFAVQDIAFSNRSRLADSNELAVLSPTLAVSVNDQQIVGLTLTNILNDYAVSDIQQQLISLELPATRTDFMTRFPEAFDSLNQLTLYGDHSEVKATYNNDELIDSLQIRWY
ncbi:hypothetical protein SAMN06297280_1393 [Arsukibacterium tuosuense]|uniref:Uncharacterized protein n=1 Tax=Arsukibacterium tuosuense TaxID=1323745 RepID=A0A285INU6_9GAMM|nr:hypothetical protein [Arsukibacterium tuosuense]SNY49397.1 hypothetical protein SAMN06297280_1393 [Arsukibacterium tuosuense]